MANDKVENEILLYLLSTVLDTPRYTLTWREFILQTDHKDAFGLHFE